MPLPVIDLSSNYEENVERWAKFLRRGRHKALVFDRIYYGKRPRKTVADLSKATGLSEKRVADTGKKLVVAGLVRQLSGGRVVYEKIPEVHHLKRRLLGPARNSDKLSRIPTKRRVRVTFHAKPGRAASIGRPRHITVDDIDDFRRVRRITRVPGSLTPPRLPEKKFKQGIQRIVDERGKFSDWGGESNDMFTTRLRVKGKRYAAALALKGPGVSGKLTPRKMGKSGNQIQRLVSGPARVFLIQREGPIDETTLDQLKRLARDKAHTDGEDVFYGIIDLRDSYRLRMAYPDAF